MSDTRLKRLEALAGPLENYHDELKYWNYGDNPAYKKFMKICQANIRGGQIIDHRTFVLDRGARLTMARNFDDFLQRDLGAKNFPRAFAIFVLFGMLFRSTNRVVRDLIPVGRFGIRKINETQFYQNFGFIGVGAAAGCWVFALYAWWQSTKFMVHKFYRHIIQQHRNWIAQSIEVSNYGNYAYPENIFSHEEDFYNSIDSKVAAISPDKENTYFGPYTPSKN